MTNDPSDAECDAIIDAHGWAQETMYRNNLRRLIRAAYAAGAASAAVPRDRIAALAAFADYVALNYPPNTVISDPSWHAPKLFRAAMYAMDAAPARQDQRCPVAENLGTAQCNLPIHHGGQHDFLEPDPTPAPDDLVARLRLADAYPAGVESWRDLVLEARAAIVALRERAERAERAEARLAEATRVIAELVAMEDAEPGHLYRSGQAEAHRRWQQREMDAFLAARAFLEGNEMTTDNRVEYYGDDRKLLVSVASSMVPPIGSFINIRGVTWEVRFVSFAVDYADKIDRTMRANVDLSRVVS